MNFYPKGLKMKEIDVDVTYSTHDKEKQKLEDNIALAFKT